MEREKNLKLAVGLLKIQFGYKRGQHSESLCFDFVAADGRIDVYNAIKGDETFYWPEQVCKIAESCRLSCHVAVREIKGERKVVLAIH